MEAVELLITLGLALVVVALAAFFRRSSSTPVSNNAGARTIEIRDPATARSLIIDHADAILNRPSPPFRPPPGRRRLAGGIFSVPYGPRWRALRSNLTADILHRSRLGVLAPLQLDAVDALVASLSAMAAAGKDVVVLRDSLHRAVLALSVRLCFGDGAGERDLRTMLQAQHEFLDLFVRVKASDRSWLQRLRHWRLRRRYFAGTAAWLNEVFLPLIAATPRRSPSTTHGGDGGFASYIDSLRALRVPIGDDDEDSGGADEHDGRRVLTNDEMVWLVWEFIGGPTLNVMSCIEWTLAHLVARSEIQERLRREIVAAAGAGHEDMAANVRFRGMPYLHAVVMESLRLHPPLPIMMRDVVHGKDAGAPHGGGGTKVTFVLGDIGRDGEVWTNPGEFRPERFLAGGEGEGVGLVPGPKEIKMMPFGAGRRYCPGAVMGMTHVKCFLAALLREFEWPPPGDAGVDMAEHDGFFKSMKTPLRARITPRNPKIR
ncbi:hypothetical protein ACP4OV_010241 [Aristida adscensionis]